jgi:hypothetical protein
MRPAHGQRKIRGKTHSFGPWNDVQAALDKDLEEQDDPRAGRTPRGQPGGVTVRDLVNQFLTAKQQLVDSGEVA